MRVIPGACVSRARLQAADGAPIPTKQMSSFLSARAAAIVIISVGDQPALELDGLAAGFMYRYLQVGAVSSSSPPPPRWGRAGVGVRTARFWPVAHPPP